MSFPRKRRRDFRRPGADLDLATATNDELRGIGVAPAAAKLAQHLISEALAEHPELASGPVTSLTAKFDNGRSVTLPYNETGWLNQAIARAAFTAVGVSAEAPWMSDEKWLEVVEMMHAASQDDD